MPFKQNVIVVQPDSQKSDDPEVIPNIFLFVFGIVICLVIAVALHYFQLLDPYIIWIGFGVVVALLARKCFTPLIKACE